MSLDPHDADRNAEKLRAKEANADPITGEPGAHPVGTGLGAAAGGMAAGAAVGVVAGPLGMAAGAAVGALLGGLAGKGVAEALDPTVEDNYWREAYRERDYVAADAPYDDYGPAYRYGVQAHQDHPERSFEEVEAELSNDWTRLRGASRLDWDRARHATRDAWNRLRERASR